MATPILKVEDLQKHFKAKNGHTVKAVNGVSFEIMPKTTYGLVGESGSGKSTIGKCIIHLEEATSGKIIFKDNDISGKLTKENKSMLRTSMQMIFQDPMASLNPKKTIGDIVGEGLDIHHSYSSREERYEKICNILKRTGLSEQYFNRYPGQLSGGQRQRAGISRALILNPDLIIADECISALDVSVQAQVVNLISDIQEEMGTAFLFIAHDLSMVKYISDKIGVLHLGYLLETGTPEEIFSNPVHPYTKSLLDTIPTINPVTEKRQRLLNYDYKTSGLDYSKGTWTHVEGEHFVLL